MVSTVFLYGRVTGSDYLITISLQENSTDSGRNVMDTLLIFSLGCVSREGKCDRASQLRTICVCSSVPVTMFPTALNAAV